MQPEAVMFTTQDQQAFHESEQSNGVLFLTPDGRIVPSESTLDAQPPHPEPEDAIMINDPAMREHCDGPNLADEMRPRRYREHHRYLNQMDKNTKDVMNVVNRGYRRPSTKILGFHTLRPI